MVEDDIALSGLKFFYLTRKLLLTVIGTIITYELVLMKYHKPPSMNSDSLC